MPDAAPASQFLSPVLHCEPIPCVAYCSLARLTVRLTTEEPPQGMATDSVKQWFSHSISGTLSLKEIIIERNASGPARPEMIAAHRADAL